MKKSISMMAGSRCKDLWNGNRKAPSPLQAIVSLLTHDPSDSSEEQRKHCLKGSQLAGFEVQ